MRYLHWWLVFPHFALGLLRGAPSLTTAEEEAECCPELEAQQLLPCTSFLPGQDQGNSGPKPRVVEMHVLLSQVVW